MADFLRHDSLTVPNGAAELTQPPSVLRLLNDCNRRLERLLENLRSEHEAEGALRAIAGDVVRAVELDADIAVAAILLNQIAGSYAVRHCIETAVIVVLLARRLGRPHAGVVTVTAAALTMNVGMLRQQESFQNKHKLDREDLAIVHRHPQDSANLLQCAGVQDDEWLSCVLLHHENDDGSGYPAGVASPDVTLNAKLLSLADRYCALVSARNYRRSLLPDQALRMLREDHDSPVDGELLDLFHRQLGDYPPGCLVRLAGGGIAVVAERSASGAVRVCSLRDTAGTVLAPDARQWRELLPTTDGKLAIAAAISEDEADVRFAMQQIWGEQASR